MGKNNDGMASRYSEENLKLLGTFYLNSFDGIFIVDKTGKLLLTNPAIEQFLHFDPEDLVGKNVTELISEGVYTGSPTMRSLETRKAFTGLVKTRDGTELVSTSKPIFDDNGEVDLIVTNCRPLKPLKSFLDDYDRRKLYRRNEPSFSKAEQELIHQSEVMQKIMKKVELIAKTDSTVLLYGETGTGKGLLAQYIHEKSYRNKGQIVEVNCAALPENLIESELFGYEKGAFTGASESGKKGLFELADRGTIFLDEIGEMPLLLQAKLLKVLDEGYILRVGGTVYHRTDARVIAATNKDLRLLVKEGRFREDLYYRLNILPLTMPSLKDRKEDIPFLTEYILKNLNSKYERTKEIDDKGQQVLLEYHWPGNIRQLKNVIERLYILSEGEKITIEDEELVYQDDSLYAATSGIEEAPAEESPLSLHDFITREERNYIQKTLDLCNGSVSAAAARLGIHRSAIYKKMNP